MNYQSLASAIMADWKSKVHDEQIKEMVFEEVLRENMNTIVEKSGE